MAQSRRLFLSYAHKDNDNSIVDDLYKDLTDAGYEVWWDQKNLLQAGRPQWTEIQQAIANCDQVLIVVGRNAFDSQSVQKEWQHAFSLCATVIALRVNGDDSLLEKINIYPYVDFRPPHPYEDGLDKLLETLKHEPVIPGEVYGGEDNPPEYLERSVKFEALIESICDGIVNSNITHQRITFLHGKPGIGKTTISRAVANDCTVKRSFADGIFWIELGKDPDIAGKQAYIGEQFGDSLNQYPDKQRGNDRLNTLLANKNAFIILDDVWDYEDAHSFQLSGSPLSRVLITARDERIATLLKVAPDKIHELDKLTEDEGIKLIAKRLNLLEGEVNPHEHTHREIVRLLEGHTQAIALAAANLMPGERGADYAPDLLQRLQERLNSGDDPFTDLNLDETDKNNNVSVSLGLSYDDLKEDMKRNFRLLGVFTSNGTFDISAASAIWSMDDLHLVEDILETLRRKNLLERTSDRQRYRIHSLMRAYAQALARRSNELEETNSRLFNHYFKLYCNPFKNNNEQRHKIIQSDFEQIQYIIGWGINHDKIAKKACDFILALEGYLTIHASLKLHRNLIQAAYNYAEGSAYKRAQAISLMILGVIDTKQGSHNFNAARSKYDQAFLLFKQEIDLINQANARMHQGDLDVLEEKYSPAREHYLYALPIFKFFRILNGMIHCLHKIGEINVHESNYDTALDNCSEAFDLTDSIGDDLGKSNILRITGDALHGLKRYSDAMDAYLNAIRATEDKYSQHLARASAAYTLAAMGDDENAVGVLHDAGGYFDATGNETALDATVVRMKNLKKQMGDARFLEAWKKVANYDLPDGFLD